MPRSAPGKKMNARRPTRAANESGEPVSCRARCPRRRRDRRIPVHAPARRARDRDATSRVRIRSTSRRRRFRRAPRETPDRRCASLRRSVVRPVLPANRCGSTSTLLPQDCSVKHADAQCAWYACRRREPRPVACRRIGRRTARFVPIVPPRSPIRYGEIATNSCANGSARGVTRARRADAPAPRTRPPRPATGRTDRR